MKLLILADIDEFHWTGGKGNADLLLSCGDVSDQVVLEAARAYDCKKIFAVKGNHDSSTPFADPILDMHLWYTRIWRSPFRRTEPGLFTRQVCCSCKARNTQ